MTDSRHLEELTLNAWPPLETVLLDGWILSFSDGYTRRANSVHPLYPSYLPLLEKIAVCESTYVGRGRETTFKITSSSTAQADLDQTLEQRGYVMAAPTSVQSADFRSTAFVVDPSVALSTTLEDGWFADFNRLTITPEVLQASERRLLEKIVPPHCFASIAIDGSTVAVGLGVAERGHVGLFDIAVDVRVRNQGVGRRLCESLLCWGQTQEAALTAYLAVMQDNAPALHLYNRLGFREVYQYWYRTGVTT